MAVCHYRKRAETCASQRVGLIGDTEGADLQISAATPARLPPDSLSLDSVTTMRHACEFSG